MVNLGVCLGKEVLKDLKKYRHYHRDHGGGPLVGRTPHRVTQRKAKITRNSYDEEFSLT